MKTIVPVLVGVLLALASAAGDAQETAKDDFTVSIERKSLRDALNDWAQQTGNQLIAEIKSEFVAPKIEGKLTAQQALERLLEGTPLTFEWIGERLVAVKEKPLMVPAALKSSGADRKGATVPMARFGGEAWGEWRVAATDQGKRPESSFPARRAEERDPDDREELEEILVTGTHIRGRRNDTAPLTVIDREQIERTGYATTQDVVRSLPQNFAGGQAGASEDGIFGVGATAASNFTGASGINLRGLGNSSTLVLLNGHRMAPSAYGSIVDVSLIPLAAVERIEVLLDGSSALYGSDAVGGVVNIITRHDYEGLNTLVRYGEAASGGREDRVIAQTAGAQWDSGGVVLAAQYQDQGSLPAADRRFALGLSRPNDLLPATESYGLAANFRQSISDAVDVYADTLLSQRDIERDYSFPEPDSIVGTSDATARGTNVAAGLRYDLAPRWHLDLGAQFSEQHDERSRVQIRSFGEERSSADVRFREEAADLTLSGTLFTSRAGSTAMALGASYRRERLDRDEVLLTGTPITGKFRRNVKAAFGELSVPLVGPSMAIPLMESLSLSGALRWDDYSTLGSTSTPRIGARWALTSDLSVRAAYSRSFRAPDPSELFVTGNAFAFVFPLVDSGGNLVNALVLTGSKPSLKPERARITSLGLEYKPTAIPGLTVTADYYRVRYMDRIVLLNVDINALARLDVYGSLVTPFASEADAQTFLDEIVASGAEFFDDGNGVAGVRSAVDFRQQNAARLEQSGVDFRAQYTKQYAGGSLSASATVSTISSIDTAFAVGASSTDLVDTLGNPVDLRGRVDLGWDSRRWMLNAAVNYIDDYRNTGAIGTPRIDNWATVDLVARMKLEAFASLSFFEGATLTLSAQNVFNEDPPFVAAPDVISVNYDPANANPLQRTIALEFVKAW